MNLQPGTFGIFPARLCKGLPPRQQLVLAWLCFHTNNETGECFPSVSTLAAECGLARRTVVYALRELESMGVVTVRKNFSDGMQKSSTYMVVSEAIDTGVQNLHSGVQNLHTEPEEYTTPESDTFKDGTPCPF